MMYQQHEKILAEPEAAGEFARWVRLYWQGAKRVFAGRVRGKGSNRLWRVSWVTPRKP